MPPSRLLTPLLKKGLPSPSHAAASLDRGRGSGQKGKCEEFPSACHQSPQALGVAAQGPAAAMESLETPIKDGILYQQHIKFGKVGTLAAPGNRWASAPASDSPPGRMGMGIRVGGSNSGVGDGIESPILSLGRWAEPPCTLGRPSLKDGKAVSGEGPRTQTLGQGRAGRPANGTASHPLEGQRLSWRRLPRWSPTPQKRPSSSRPVMGHSGEFASAQAASPAPPQLSCSCCPGR